MITTSNALALRGVTKSYGATRAVSDLDLTVERGSTVALLGPNGAGKSTLVGMMVGLVRPDSGTVRVAGLPAVDAVASGRIAAMLQDAGLMPGVRVGELVQLGSALYPDPFPVDDALRFLLKDLEPDELRHAVHVVAAGDALLTPGATRSLIASFVASQPRHEPAGDADVDSARRSLAGLTEREREIVALIARGLGNDEIAARLVISPTTVKTHVSHAMIKLRARDRAQLVVFAYESGLVA